MSHSGPLTTAESHIDEKMKLLEKTVKTFRGEVDMKLNIIVQILNNRKDQFQIQQELLRREQFLFETVLGHWDNVADMAANGLCLKFSDTPTEFTEIMGTSTSKVVNIDLDQEMSVRKRSEGPTPVRRKRSKRVRSKRMRGTNTDDETSNSETERDESKQENDVSNPDQDSSLERIPPDETMDLLDSYHGATDESWAEMDNMEKKVFVDVHVVKPTNSKDTKGINNPVWKYFLREEYGKSGLCKPCDSEGKQSIIRTSRGRTSNLVRHLQRHHGDLQDVELRLGGHRGNGNDCGNELLDDDDTKRTIPKEYSDVSVNKTPINRNPVGIENKKIRTNNHPVWKYFLRDDAGNTGLCKLCNNEGKQLTIGANGPGRLSNLVRHLKRIHSDLQDAELGLGVS